MAFRGRNWTRLGRITCQLGVCMGMLLVLGACSTSKNTWFRRTYHRVTSYFNYYFNAEQAYEAGSMQAARAMQYDYTRVLPLSIAGLPDAGLEAGGDMDRAVEKCASLIRLHSITVKPARKKGKKMSRKEKDFYNQNEFNKYARKAWLLLGKARIWSGDMLKAREALEFSMRQFSKQTEGWESQLWMGRMEMLTGQPLAALERFKSLSRSKLRPKKDSRANFHLEGMWADLHVAREEYAEAIPHAELAVKASRRGVERNRCQLALAQLYERVGQYDKAFEYYGVVARRADRYEMMFNARVRQASLAARVQGKGMDKALERMARDEKNLEYLDQIYYALAQISLSKGDTLQAISLYKESAQRSVNNAKQKGVSHLAVADYYYSRHEFLAAQQFYDSALSVLPEDYPGRAEVARVGTVLNRLAAADETIRREDSLQQVARMPERARNELIQQLIKAVEEEERLQEEEAERQRQNQRFARQNQFRSQYGGAMRPTEQGWYFYNSQTLASGEVDFRMYWGNRKLEDNWRRKNKQTLAFGGAEPGGEGSSEAGGKELTNKMPEYYLQHVPLTDSSIRASNARIVQAYLALGDTYRDELQRFAEASLHYGRMATRYPEAPEAPEACFRAYECAQKVGDAARGQEFKQRLLTRYGGSPYALRLTDPDYMARLQAQHSQNEALYAQALEHLQSGDRTRAHALAQQGVQANPLGEYLPRFELLSALSIGREPATLEQVDALKTFVKQHTGTPEATYAREVLTAITRRELTGARITEEETLHGGQPPTDLKVDFIPFEEESMVVLVVRDTVEVNAVRFQLIDFSVEYNVNLALEVRDEVWAKVSRLLRVEGFAKRKDAEEYLQALRRAHVLDTLQPTYLVISPENYNLLKEIGLVSPYLEFYRRLYGR